MHEEGRKGIMYGAASRRAFTLCACLVLVACASMDRDGAQPSAGYWSQVEDFGTNPPPEGYAAGEATFYPYVQMPQRYNPYGAGYGYGEYGSVYGGLAGFDESYGRYGMTAPGFGSFYYPSAFYGDPFFYGRPIFMPAPGATPTPRPAPPPAHTPRPHPVKPGPARPPVGASPVPPRPGPPPRARSDRGAQPVKD